MVTEAFIANALNLIARQNDAIFATEKRSLEVTESIRGKLRENNVA